MPRWCMYQVPVDTGFFTPIGLQPTAVFRLAFNSAGQWLSRNAISHRRLVTEHGTGFVVWSAQLVSDQSVNFLDSDCLEIRVTGRVRGGGTQFECEGQLGLSTRLHACCVPLRLGGDPALSGAPARLSPEVMAAFLPDEIVTKPSRSMVPALFASVAREGLLLARSRMPFTIHRHQCEVADQWFWPEAASLAGGGREELVRAEADRVPLLRLGLSAPVRRLDLLFNSPFFLFDAGTVVSTANEWQGRLVFMHELIGDEGEPPRALAIEQFAVGEQTAWD